MMKVQSDSTLRLADILGRSEIEDGKGSNFVYSPLSIRVALSLVAVGSKKNTLDEFLSFLASTSVDDLIAVNAGVFGQLTAFGNGHDGSCSLSSANGIWIDQSYVMKDSFKKIAESVYKAAVESVNFIDQASQVEREVNAWASKYTQGLIKDIIPVDSLKSGTRLVLANALHFKGIWAKEFFRKSDTKTDDFYLLDGSTIQVHFMTGKYGEYYLNQYNGFKVLQLPYQYCTLSMLLYLPNAQDGLSSLIHKSTSDPNFFDWHFPGPCSERLVHKLMIPKFKFSFRFQASESLQSLGLITPFSEVADFGEMILSPVNDELCISKVHHKATIEVEEKGTIASASTVVEMICGSSGSPRTPYYEEFVADHPFMFAIRENETGAILFLGHVADPSSE